MTKLNKRKIRWIMNELDNGELSVRQIAKTQKVSPRRVRQLREHKRKTGTIFQLKTERKICQRKITAEEIAAVFQMRKKYKMGAIFLEKILAKEQKKIPHNVIQKILEQRGFAMPLRKKVKRKDWVRYERKHSNSLWHIDWTLLGDNWFIAIQDDASRLIVGYGEFAAATTANSLKVLRGAMLAYGKPRAMLSGRDVQFYCSEKEGKKQGMNDFQKFLEANNIKHIIGRVNHPQTNGKVERFFGEVKAKIHEFENTNELVQWYNEIKPHMSLDFDNLETPIQAFKRKMHHKNKEKQEIVIVEVK